MSNHEHRVIHIHFGRNGGQARFLLSLSQELKNRGIEQRFIIRPNRVWGKDVATLGPVVTNDYRRLTPSGWLLHCKVRRIVREWKPTVMMAWGPRAARLIPNAPGSVRLARLGDPPRHLKYYHNCDVIVGNTPDIVQRAIERGWNRTVATITNFPRHTRVVPCSRSRMRTPDDAYVISSAGRFVDIKGFDCLIRATAKVPNAWLWLLGDGLLKRELQSLVSRLDLDSRVRFPGWVEEPMNYIAASNVVVVPSRYEALGNVVLEAWQTGVPVIATRSKGPSWLITDQEDGLLVDIDAIDDLALAMTAVQQDSALVQKLSAGGKSRIAKDFSRDRIVAQYLELFDSALA